MGKETIKTIQGRYLSLWLFETTDSRGRKHDEVWTIQPLRDKRKETPLARTQILNWAPGSNRKLRLVIHAPIRSRPLHKKLQKVAGNVRKGS